MLFSTPQSAAPARRRMRCFERPGWLRCGIENDREIIKTMEERKQNREGVLRNQGIGQLVERLLRDQLEAAGVKVERTGRGSDFEVESDFVEDGHEVLLRLGIGGASTLLEV